MGETIIQKQLAQKEEKDPVKELIMVNESAIAASLPQGIDVNKFKRDVMTALSETPKLRECEPKSLIMAFMASAQLGLTPNNPRLGQAWIIPYKKYINGKSVLVAEFQFGYKGLMELAYRDSRVSTIVARTVYENDVIDIDFGNQTVNHKPALNGTRGNAIGYYAFIKLRDGGQFVDYMSKDTVIGHMKKFVKSYEKNDAWSNHFDRMAEKTVLIGALRYMPKSLTTTEFLAQDGIVRGAEQFDKLGEGQQVLEMEGTYNDLVVEGEVVEQN